MPRPILNLRTFFLGALLVGSTLGMPSRRAAAMTELWHRSLGDASFQRANSVATDAAGNAIVTGYFSGTLDFGTSTLTSPDDGFLAKFDPSGTCMWSRKFAATGGVSTSMVATDADGNVAVCGMFMGTINPGGGTLTSAGIYDAFVAVYDANGGFQWARRFGDNKSQAATAVTFDPSGNVIVAGGFYGTIDAGGGPLVSAGFDDVFLVKYTGSGGHLWSHRYGDANDQWPASVATDPSGEILLGGWYSGSLDFGGGPHTSLGANDAFLAKLTAAGNEAWSRSFGSAAATDQSIYGVASGPNGEVYAVGSFYGDVDFGTGLESAPLYWSDGFLVAFDAAGVAQWTRHFMDVDYLSDQNVNAVATDAAGSIFVTGSTTGPVNVGGSVLVPMGAEDVIVAAYDPNGTHRESQRYGDSASQFSQSIATAPGGHVVVAGQFYGSLDFGGGAMTDPGQANGFVVDFGSATSGVTANLPTDRLSLRAFPNPAKRSSTIEFTLTAASTLTLDIFDARGARVARLAEGAQPAGTHALRWNCRGADGREVPPGIYLARIAYAGAVTSRRIVVLE